MSPQLIAELKSFYQKHPECVGVAVNDQKILEIEHVLQVKCDPFYRSFIQKFGGAYAGLSIYAIENADILGNETVVQMTQHAREMVQEYNSQHGLLSGLVISDDGVGNPIYIRVDSTVYVFYHDDFTEKYLAENLEQLIQDSFTAW